MNFSKKVLASLLAATSIAAPFSAYADTVIDSSQPFKDLNQAATWSRDSILQSKLLGLFEGDKNGNFRPKDQITRQEMAKILVQLLNLPLEPVRTPAFDDVKANEWSAAYIEAARKAGIMQGYGNGKFDPKAVMTREQLAIVFVKALQLPLENDIDSLKRFEDASSIHDWSAQYVAAALKAGLMVGNGSKFDANVKANRQEAAMIAVRVHTQKQQATTQPTLDNGTPTVPPQSVIPGKVVQPEAKTDIKPITPSTGGGTTIPVTPSVTPPVTPPVTTPVTPPVEKSLPAIATSRTMDVLNFQSRFSSSAQVSSSRFTNLNFGMAPSSTLTSATSNTITSMDWSGSNSKFLNISDGKNTAFITMDNSYTNLGEIVQIINNKLTLEGVEASAQLDASGNTFTVARTSLNYDGKLEFTGPNVALFFEKSLYAPETIDRSTQVKLKLANDQIVTLDLNKNYANVEEIQKSWYAYLNSIEANVQVMFDFDVPGPALKIYTKSHGSDQKFTILPDSDPAIFKEGLYVGTDDDIQSKYFEVNDGAITANIELYDSYSDVSELVKAIDQQLETYNIQATAELASPYTFKITSKSIGKQAKLTISGRDANFFFDQYTFAGSGPQVDQAPLISGVPIRSMPEQFFSIYELRPVSADTDIVEVELMRSTPTKIDYSVTDYNYPVTGYTLGTPISEEGSYRLTVKNKMGKTTVTYFSIERTWPAIISVTQQQNPDFATSPYQYDQGDKITFKLNTFVQKYDSSDELDMQLPPNTNGITLSNIKAWLPDPSYTFGSGAKLTTDEVMPNHPAYGRIFTITLGRDANIPAIGTHLMPYTGDLSSPSSVTPYFPELIFLPALAE